MGKKINKFLVLTAIVGAAAGTYYYLQNKDKKTPDQSSDDEDFDDFDDFDDLDKEESSSTSSKERSYVTLDKKVDLTAAKDTAKEVFDTVKEKMATVVSKVSDAKKPSFHAFEQASDNFNKKDSYSETLIPDIDDDDYEEDAEEGEFVDNTPYVEINPVEKIEEFFDDEEEKKSEDVMPGSYDSI